MRFLLLAAFSLAGSYGLASALLGRPTARSGGPSLACPAFAPRLASADRIELAHAGQVLWLERRGAVWGMARQGGYPVQPERAAALTSGLLALKLLRPAPGTADTQGLADPFLPGAASGTFIRVLGTSGATLCSVVAGTGPIIRRAGDSTAWIANAPVEASADAEAWSQHALPPLDPASIRAVLDDGNLGAETVGKILADLPFADVRPRPLIHPALVRTLQLELADGTAVLAVGTDAGLAWLVVSGTSSWASRLAPYAFALPPDSPLAGS